MKISRKIISKDNPVYESQAKFLALCILQLDERTKRIKFDPDDKNDVRDFWKLPEYIIFHDATYACGFVCNDYSPDFNINAANINSKNIISKASFEELRHYIHTLMRAERSNQMDGYFSPVLKAVLSDALTLVAIRLNSDDELYEIEM